MKEKIRNDQDLLNLISEEKNILPEEYGPFVERCHCQNAVRADKAKIGNQFIYVSRNLLRTIQ